MARVLFTNHKAVIFELLLADKVAGALLTNHWVVIVNLLQYFYFRWVTVNDTLACEDPCFFCATCFKGLHYAPNGEKICDFQAYPVVGDFDW